jgi:adenine-specific DNA methylase
LPQDEQQNTNTALQKNLSTLANFAHLGHKTEQSNAPSEYFNRGISALFEACRELADRVVIMRNNV